MKILLFKIGALGDVLMTTPLIRQLRKNYPKAEIDYLIGNTSSVILKNNKYLNQVINFDEAVFFKKNLFGFFKLLKKIKKNKYDIIFILDKHWIFNLTAKFFNIKQRIGFDRLGKEGKFLTKKIRYEKVRHEIFYYLDLLKSFGGKVNYKDFKMDIFLTGQDKKFADDFWKKNKLNKKVIAIAPGGGKNFGQIMQQKIWSYNNYAKLISKLIEKNIKVVLIGGKDDVNTVKVLISKLKSKDKKSVINLVAKTNIQQSAAIMKKCFCIFCNDSGPMHIANSVNDKIISIFGPTNALRLAPLSKNSVFLWKQKTACYNIFGDFSRCKGNEIESVEVADALKAYNNM